MCDLLSLPLPWPVREQTIVWLVTRQSRTVLLVVSPPSTRGGVLLPPSASLSLPLCLSFVLSPCSRFTWRLLLASEDTALPSSKRKSARGARWRPGGFRVVVDNALTYIRVCRAWLIFNTYCQRERELTDGDLTEDLAMCTISS